MNIRIRKATDADIPQILNLYAELQPLDPQIDIHAAYSVYKKAVGNGVTYFVAEHDRRIIGTCYIAIIPNMTRQCSSIGFIENTVIAANCRRKGIGRQLMNAVIDFAKECNCYKVTLQSGSKREEAHEFYKTVGFDGNSKRAFEIRF